MAFDARRHPADHVVRGPPLSQAGTRRLPRLLYLDWLRGIAVLGMVFAHVLDSWTRDADRNSEPYYSLFFVAGVASSLFLFLAGVATAMSAGAKGRQAGDPAAGARAARWRGAEVFVLGLLFRVQAQLLGFGPVHNLLKVDMLNVMGLSMVASAVLWQLFHDRRTRVAAFALATTMATVLTPPIRATTVFAPLPDPLEAYLRPAGTYSAFPAFPWAGFLFAGIIVGDLVDGWRVRQKWPAPLHLLFGVVGATALAGGYSASFRPALFPTADFWHDSPTLFLIRLGMCTVMVPIAWLLAEPPTGATASSAEGRTGPGVVTRALAAFGRSSLFVYWIHVEMVYGVIADPIKRTFPLWASLSGAALLSLLLYLIVLLKNRWIAQIELPRPIRIFAAVLR